MMAADTMEALGIPRGSYVVKVSNRKVLDGVLEVVGLNGEQTRGGDSPFCARSISLIDWADDGVRQLLAGDARTNLEISQRRGPDAASVQTIHAV